MSSNLFSKIKNVFTKNPDDKTPPAKTPEQPRRSITLGDIISDEIRQFRRRGLSRKYQPYTRDEILQDSLESERLFQLYKLIDEVSTQSNEDLEGRNFSMYFKSSKDTVSKRFYEHFYKAEKVDISSQEVQELTTNTSELSKKSDLPLFCIAMFGFYDQEEPVLGHIYPDLEAEIGLSKEIKDLIEKNLATSVMPDAVYNTPEDYLYFVLNVEKRSFEVLNKEAFEKLSESDSQDNALLYGVSFFKQLPITSAIKEKYPNINRPHIQRAICVISRIPMFGRLVSHFEPLVKEHFRANPAEEQEAIKELYTHATPILKEITIDSHELQSNVSVKKLVCFLREKTTTLWRALFLERRILVFSEHPSSCSTFIHTLLSLFPCACHFNYHSRALTNIENHYGEYGLPLQILHDKCPLLPNFGMQHVEEISTGKGFLGGTSNFLIKTLSKVGWDIMIDIDTNTLHFKNDTVKRIFTPSKLEKDLINGILKKLEKKIPKDNVAWNKLDNESFADNDDDVEYEGTEEWIRQKFYDHLKSLLTEIEFFRYHASAEKLEPTLQVYNSYLAKKGEESEGRGSIIRLSHKSGGSEKDNDSEHKSEDRVDSASPSPFKNTDQQFFPSEETKENSAAADKAEDTTADKSELQHKKSIDELQTTIERASHSEGRKDSRSSLSEIKDEDLHPDDPRVALKNDIAPIKNSMKVLRDYGVDWLLEWGKTDNFRNWARENRALIRERSANNASAKDHFWSYENGDLYVGDLINGQRHGSGQYLYRHSRLIYKGEWENDKKSGSGMLSSLGGTDLVYDGNFKNDKKEGFGRLIQGKERYVGTFVSDRYEGSGVLIDSEQNVYEGDFKDGYKWGMGKIKYANGETYVGETQKDLFHGQGQFIYSNGDVYSGGFDSGKKHGYGILQIASGDIFEGHFVEDEFCGRGTLKKSDGHKYEGEFCRSLLVAEKPGIIHYPDGSRYEGFIVNFKPHGKGKIIRKEENGEVVTKGRFEDGELVEEFKEEEPEKKEAIPVEEERKEENVAPVEEPTVENKENVEEQGEVQEETHERVVEGADEEVLLDEKGSDSEPGDEDKEVPIVNETEKQEKGNEEEGATA